MANEEASSRFQDSFPKNESRFLSHYQYKRRYIEITPNGEIVGDLSRMFVSLIDLSFTRSLVADVYGKRGYHCYDPANIFCLEISRILDGYKDTKSFCRVLRDPQRGFHYWAYAGLVKEHIPSEKDVEKKRPLIKLFSFSFSRFDPNKEQDATSRLLGIEERLKELLLMLIPLKSSINLIQMSSSLDTCWIKCPRLPSDIEARRGVRRSGRSIKA